MSDGYNLLEGIRVLEIALATPNALGMHLADMGAEVLKIEEPPEGDYVRLIGDQLAGASLLHHRWNRGKKSVTLSLKTDEGRRLFFELVQKSHVVVDGLRAGAVDRFGVGYEKVKAVNPSIVWLSFNATGQSGPYRDLATHSTGFDSYAGLLTPSIREDGLATLGRENLIGIQAAPLYAALGVLSAVIRSLRTGEGSRLETSHFDACAAWAGEGIDRALNGVPGSNEGMGPAVRHQAYRTKDDRFIIFQCSEDKFWVNFCENVGRPDLLEGHERKKVFSHARGDEALRKEIADIVLTKTRREWVDFFLEHNAAGSPVNAPEELIDDPHFQSRGMLFDQDYPDHGTLRWVGSPLKVEGQAFSTPHAPLAGEHTAEVLANVLGLSSEEIEDLTRSGAASQRG